MNKGRALSPKKFPGFTHVATFTYIIFTMLCEQ